jgi:hypothetical protein
MEVREIILHLDMVFKFILLLEKLKRPRSYILHLKLISTWKLYRGRGIPNLENKGGQGFLPLQKNGGGGRLILHLKLIWRSE